MEREEIIELFRQLEVEVVTDWEGHNKYITVNLKFEGETISSTSERII